MAVRLLTDFHHSSLLRATNMLFGERLGMEVYRPIGMEWHDNEYWAINDNYDTAKQFLSLEQSRPPKDNTPPLNDGIKLVDGVFIADDPGGYTSHLACTLDFFKRHRFDYLIASIPQHVPIFEELIRKFQPGAKLIVQIGNNWDLSPYEGKNVLASTAPHLVPGVNVYFYHQEFDRFIFSPKVCRPTKKIYSYVNILQGTGQGWNDFIELERLLPEFEFRSYGGQCRDGNKNGPRELASSMHESQFVFHSKPGGDGFGHIIFNAYACGRPVITRRSQYEGKLAEQLLVPGTFIDLDACGRPEARKLIKKLTDDTDALSTMGNRAAEQFTKVVNYDDEARGVNAWLATLL